MMEKLMIFLGGTELPVSGGPSRVAWVFEGLAGMRQGTSWGNDQEALWLEILPDTPAAARTGLLELCTVGEEAVMARVDILGGVPDKVEWMVDTLHALPRYWTAGIAPMDLTDRFGAWQKDWHSQNRMDFLTPLLSRLDNEFGEGLEEDGKKRRFWVPNDPRKLLQDGQVSSILAYFRGQIGIWTEAEVWVDPDGPEATEDVVEAHEQVMKTLTEATLPLRDKFPGTHFFLVEGDAALLDGPSVCGFTPLPGQASLAFDISGPVADQIMEIEDILVQIP